MKKNTKFLLIYVAILFSFALVLILFAGLTQNNYAKELAESQGIKQNYVEITEQYQTLTDSMKVLNDRLEEANAECKSLEEELQTLTEKDNVTNLLLEALVLYDGGNESAAKEKLAKLDKTKLNETQKHIYDKIN